MTIQLVDVTVRDALQRVTAFVPTGEKAALARALAAAGLRRIEVTAFRPDRPAQFEDAADLLAMLDHSGETVFRPLCYHAEGVGTALRLGVREVALNVGTTDAFEARFGRTVAEAWQEALRGIGTARRAGVRVVASLSHGLDARLDEEIWSRLTRVLDPLVEAGVNEITLADTRGRCTGETGSVFYAAVATRYPGVPVALHFHEGAGAALDNLADAILGGCATFEVGLRPHPEHRAGDNADTIGAAAHLESVGVPSGLDRSLLAKARALLSTLAASEPIMV